MILLDTDHLTVLTDSRDAKHEELAARVERVRMERFAVPIVAAEEQCRGWLAESARQRDAHRQVLAYERLARVFDFLGEWEIARFDVRAADGFARLCKQLRRLAHRI